MIMKHTLCFQNCFLTFVNFKVSVFLYLGDMDKQRIQKINKGQSFSFWDATILVPDML